ncbi:MAG: hypothetical protein O2960_28835, partial [Verrucomicrobia bacterium]|nr:hypothetical protein [Verrucomicrobiota bacterium]
MHRFDRYRCASHGPIARCNSTNNAEMHRFRPQFNMYGEAIRTEFTALDSGSSNWTAASADQGFRRTHFVPVA